MHSEFTNKGKPSISRAIHAQMARNPSEAALEYELSRYIEEETGKPAQGIYLSSRDLNTGTDSAGGNLVETSRTGELIPSLRDQSQVFKLGAIPLNDLIGNVDLPTISSGVALTNTAENTSATKQDPVFGMVSLSPEQYSVQIDLSRKLIKQSSITIDEFIEKEIHGAVASKIDQLAVLEILNHASVPVVAMGTNGALPTWDKICDLEAAVSVPGGIVNNPGWMTNHAVSSQLKRREKATGSEFIYSNDGGLSGYPIGLTGMVPSDLDKGTSVGLCSAMVFGSFDQLVVAQWGALDVVVDRHSMGINGGVRITVWFDVAIGLRQPGSFAVIKDLLTV